MKIKLHNKIIADISSIDELTSYIKQFVYVDMMQIPTHLHTAILNLLQSPHINKTELHKKIRSIFSDGGKILSRYQPMYWVNRGYNEERVDEIIQSLQSKNTPRHIDYWRSKGISDDEARLKVSEYQTKLGNVNKTLPSELLAKRSPRCIEYWIHKGYSDMEARIMVSTNQRKITSNYWKSATPEQRSRHSMKGTLNGMYGKPSPIKSGHGISGWYNGLFFRSLHELNYMVNILDRFNIPYKLAEASGIRIEYVDATGTNRTYSADFIVSDKYYVEVKPKPLFNITQNVLKRNAAIDFCNNNGLKYKMTDCGSINISQLLSLVDSGSVTFTKNYEMRINQYLYKVKSNITDVNI